MNVTNVILAYLTPTRVVLTEAEFDARVRHRLLMSHTEVPVCEVGQENQDGEEEERYDRLPQLDDVRTDPLEDNQEPEVGEHGEERRHEEHLITKLNPTIFQ